MRPIHRDIRCVPITTSPSRPRCAYFRSARTKDQERTRDQGRTKEQGEGRRTAFANDITNRCNYNGAGIPLRYRENENQASVVVGRGHRVPLVKSSGGPMDSSLRGGRASE